MSSYRLTHLRQLEAESIHIIREVAAEFENPVMLYSIGKDSSVMVQLALKAFYPAKPPFPLLHVDTTWKFREMIEFRENYARKELGLEVMVHINEEGVRAGVSPFTYGSKRHTDIMKTEALLQALSKYKFDAAFGGARRDEEKSRAKERVFSFRDKNHRWDPEESASGTVESVQRAKSTRGRASGSSRYRTGRNSTSGNTSIWRRFRSSPCTLRRLDRSSNVRVTMIMVDDDRLPLEPGEEPVLKTVRFRTLGCYPLTGAVESTAVDAPRNHSGDAVDEDLRATGTRDRLRSVRVDGRKEERRVLLACRTNPN